MNVIMKNSYSIVLLKDHRRVFMSKLSGSLVQQAKSITITTKETEINPITCNTKEVVVSS